MAKFKKGDRVVVNGNTSRKEWVGATGVVAETGTGPMLFIILDGIGMRICTGENCLSPLNEKKCCCCCCKCGCSEENAWKARRAQLSVERTICEMQRDELRKQIADLNIRIDVIDKELAS